MDSEQTYFPTLLSIILNNQDLFIPLYIENSIWIKAPSENKSKNLYHPFIFEIN